MATFIRFFTLILLSLHLWATDSNTTVTAPDAADTAVESPGGQPGTLFMRYENLTPTVHKNQIFRITVSALIPSTEFDELSSTLSNYTHATILSANPDWVEKDPSTYTLTLIMKAEGETIRTPDITTLFKTADGRSQVSTLEGITVKTVPLIVNPSSFCGVLAQSLGITSYKIDKYDNASNIVVLEIDSRLGNMSDFKLTGVLKQGIDSLKTTLPTAKMFYYAIIPSSQRTLEFEYYNTSLESFQSLRIDIDPAKIADQTVSTQTDINPRNSSATLFKALGLLIVIAASLGAFYYKRHPLFLAPALPALIALGFILFPSEEITLRQGAKITLLPTASSTVFKQTAGDMRVKQLKTVDGWTKIQLESGDQIGWVKNDEIR